MIAIIFVAWASAILGCAYLGVANWDNGGGWAIMIAFLLLFVKVKIN